MGEHSSFGGSVAGRYLNCAGSVALCGTVPPLPSGLAAMIGTAAHALAEECLCTGTDAEHYRGAFFPKDAPVREKFIVEDDMIRAVQVYLDEVRAELSRTPEAELYVEHKFALDLPSADPGEVFGTNDALVYHPTTGRLRVFDYKHGQGVSVSAEDNPQLKFYAIGAAFSKSEWTLDDLVLTIVQPRANDVDTNGAVRDWSMDPIDLLDFHSTLDKAVKAAKASEPGQNLVAGSWCRWCDAAAICPTKHREVLELATIDPSSFTVDGITTNDLPPPKTLDMDRLAKIVAGIDRINEWARQCQELLEGLVLSGHDVPGWKAVEKIGRAKWVSAVEDIVTEASLMYGVPEAALTPPSLVTITEAKRLLKEAGVSKEDVEDFLLRFTIKESSGLTVAPASDRRPAVNAAAQDFGSVKI